MNPHLDKLIDEILGAIFDGRGAETPAAMAGIKIAALLLSASTTRADLVRAISTLILEVDVELGRRETLRHEQRARERREQMAREPKAPAKPPREAIFRRYREAPIVHAPAGRGDPNHTLLGDPAPGRSALDQRNGEYL